MSPTRVAFLSMILFCVFFFLDLHPGSTTLISSSSAQSVSGKPAERPALILFKDKQYQQIVDTYLPQIEKLSIEEIFVLAQSQALINQDLAAIKTYQLLIAKFPKDSEAKLQLAKLHLKSKKEREALTILKELLESAPKFEPAYILAGEIYESKNNRYELRLLYIDMISKIGERGSYVTKICELANRDGLYEMSTLYCKRGMKINPQEPKNYVYYGLTLNQTGQPKEAEAYLEKAAKGFAQSEFAQTSYALFLDEKKRYTESVVYYEASTRAKNSTEQGRLGLAQAQFEIQKYESSLENFKSSCENNRQAVVNIRRNVNILRQLKQLDWATKFEGLAENCTSRFLGSATDKLNK
jgi:tetratricopeptide (TPR) repeat protein